MNQQTTILIVDDGALGRATLESLLLNLGYRLEFATNGFEALKIAAEVLPDVVLLDVMMPEMDGFEVCKRLRATPQIADVPVILVTALDDRESRLRGIEAGADDFVSKPFDRVELRARVKTIVRLNRYQRLLGAKAQFEWVVDQATDGFVIVDTKHAVRYANPQARRYLGLSDDPSEPVQQTFLARVYTRYRCEPHAAWVAWAEGQCVQTPMFLVLPESQTTASFWLQVDTFDLPGPSTPERLVRLRDVTQQVSLQRDTRSFHAMIDHKLRTSMTSLHTSVEMLTGDTSRLTPESFSTVADNARQGIRRLRSEIEDVLQYVRAPAQARHGEGISLAKLGPLLKEIGVSLRLQAIALAWQTGLDELELPLTPRAAELV
ncbi:MAG TPA: response regulator, partial [Roseiflexaceae bacterium]|nr:response regulator [Roseiflexaceae bacterium]